MTYKITLNPSIPKLILGNVEKKPQMTLGNKREEAMLKASLKRRYVSPKFHLVPRRQHQWSSKPNDSHVFHDS